MTGTLGNLDQRSSLVGQNRLELLLYKLNSKQVYGVNVFKVKEVLQCPKLTELPQSNQVIRGIAHIRGHAIPVLDMGLAMGGPPLEDIDNCLVIISEFNMSVQGFLVASVERIVNLDWGKIHPPPKGTGSGNYLTAVTEIDNNIVEIIDVEKILSEVSPVDETLTDESINHQAIEEATERELSILVVDDSNVARKQIQRCAEKVGVNVQLANDGKEALDHLNELVDEGLDVKKVYLLVISDIEMPEMDGYTLTASIKMNPKLSGLFVLLHTSLSGIFNEKMVEKVGADDFLAKFSPDKLASIIQNQVEKARQHGS